MRDYFVYLPETPQSMLWGCSATSTGCARVAPGSVYPPERHPDDHHFTWERGRILQSYQFVLISEGRGVLESQRPGAKWPVQTGTLLVLFPGIWHRYAPDPATGWVEHWIELRGAIPDRARDGGRITPENPAIDTRSEPGIAETFSRIHSWAHTDAVGHQDLITTLGLHILALLAHCNRDVHDRIGDKIRQAQTLLAARARDSVDLEALARELEMGYSHFRQAFKARTGISPKQFHQEFRIRRAQEFLLNTGRSLEEIADLLGFSSAFHLSRQFKEVTGIPPREWRADVLRGKPAGLQTRV